MENFLLDSSIILEILDGSSDGKKAMETIKPGKISTSVICYCEVLNKIDLVSTQKAEVFLSKLIVYGLSLSDGDLAKNLQFDCRKNGKQVPTLDCLIAATAMNNDAVLISSDKDFDRINNLKKILF